MKFCVSYYKDFRYNDVVDEIVFSYANFNDGIVNEMKNWKDEQRIIIDICYGGEPKIIPILQMCKKKHENLVIRLSTNMENMVKKLQEAGLPYFFSNYAKTADEVYSMIKRGATDVYVTENLGFNLKDIGFYCKSKRISVRVIPNIAQYAAGFGEEVPDAYKFFVRPEDVDLYDQYVNVFEIVCPNNKLSVTYEIYRNGVWTGDLGQLIIGLREPFYNSGIVDYFGEARIKCQHRCMQEKCQLCQNMKELAGRLYENNLAIESDRKEWKSETKSYQEIVQLAEKTITNNDVKVSQE